MTWVQYSIVTGKQQTGFLIISSKKYKFSVIPHHKRMISYFLSISRLFSFSFLYPVGGWNGPFLLKITSMYHITPYMDMEVWGFATLAKSLDRQHFCSCAVIRVKICWPPPRGSNQCKFVLHMIMMALKLT